VTDISTHPMNAGEPRESPVKRAGPGGRRGPIAHNLPEQKRRLALFLILLSSKP
jgi:hypothetical protein